MRGQELADGSGLRGEHPQDLERVGRAEPL